MSDTHADGNAVHRFSGVGTSSTVVHVSGSYRNVLILTEKILGIVYPSECNKHLFL